MKAVGKRSITRRAIIKMPKADFIYEGAQTAGLGRLGCLCSNRNLAKLPKHRCISDETMSYTAIGLTG